MTDSKTICGAKAQVPPSPPSNGWEPIETAPKDGKDILLANRFGAWSSAWAGDDWRSYYYSEPPTHWMHLPAPPVESPTESGDDQLKAIGSAINRALYKTPYDGQLNIPCLSKEQELAAARAAVSVIASFSSPPPTESGVMEGLPPEPWIVGRAPDGDFYIRLSSGLCIADTIPHEKLAKLIASIPDMVRERRQLTSLVEEQQKFVQIRENENATLRERIAELEKGALTSNRLPLRFPSLKSSNATT